MVEILWHGRGGQGAFTAARLLGAAASLDDTVYALAFPSFGPERRGAPMRAFTKISKVPIGDRSAIKKADFVVYLDDTLFDDSWAAELKPDGHVLVNSQKTAASLGDTQRIIAIDANRISTEILGRPIPNTVFLGALAALGVLDVSHVKSAIEGYMAPKLHESNKRIVDAAYAYIAQMGGGISVQDAREVAPDESSGSTDARADEQAALVSALGAHALSERLAQYIPTLRYDELDPSSFARSTCFSAGHLVDKNAGWRNMRPVVNEALCTDCLQCYMHCPDGVIYKVDSHQGKRPHSVAIDYDFCKGCGVCVKACKFGAIAMVDEPSALAAEARANASLSTRAFAQGSVTSSDAQECEVRA